MTRRRRWLMTLGLTAGLLVVADVLAGELYIQGGLVDGAPPPPFGRLGEEQRAQLQEVVAQGRQRGAETIEESFDAELGWCVLPGPFENRFESGNINSLGARGPEVDPVAPEGGVLVACFGESFTYGSEVGDHQTYPAALDALDERVRALNFGVGGYGTDQALLRYRRDGQQLGADVVVIGYMLENVNRNVNRYRRLYSPRPGPILVKPRFLLREGQLELVPQPYPDRLALLEAALDGSLIDTMSEHDHWAGDEPLVACSNLARIRALSVARERRRHELHYQRRDEAYQLTVALLDAFHAEALADGAEHALVVVLPSRKDHRWPTAEADAWRQAFLNDLSARGVATLDAVPVLRALGEEAFVGRHLSPIANQVLAEAVLGALREELPALRHD